MSIATLSIDLVAQLAKFEQGLTQATGIAQKQAALLQRAYGGVTTVVTALGVAAAGAIAALQVRDSINIADRVDDLAEKFGIAADRLSEYRFAAEVAGTPTDALASGLGKLSKAAAENNKGLAAMGIRLKDAQGNLRSVDDLLLDVADKFSSYEDGAAKAALAQDVFGKSGADLIPLLNRGRQGIVDLRDDALKLGAAFGKDVAEQAGRFNDQLKTLELSIQGLKVSIVGELLPSLNQVTSSLIEGRKAYGGWLKFFADDIKINPFGSLSSEADFARKQLEKLQQELVDVERRAGSSSLADKLLNAIAPPDAIKAHAQERIATLQARLKYLNAINRDAEEQFKDTRAVPITAPGKTAAPLAADVDLIKKAAEAYRGLIDEVAVRLTQSGAELDAGQRLTEFELFRLRVEQKLVENKEGLSQAQQQSIRASLSALGVMDDEIRKRKLLADVQEYSTRLTDDAVAALNRESEARVVTNEQLRQQIQEFGLTTSALEDLRLKRLQDAAAQEEAALIQARNAGASQSELDAMERRLRLLQQQIVLEEKGVALSRRARLDPTAGVQQGVQAYLERIREAGTATAQVVSDAAASLEDDLTSSLRNGRLDVSRFIDTVISEFLRLQVVRPLLDSLFGGSGGGGGLISSFFSTIFGGGRATGGPVSAGKLYEVNERGMPELLNVGGKQLLMMGKQSGTVTPTGQSSRGAGGGQVQIVNNVQAGMTRGEVLSAIQIAMQGTQAAIYEQLRVRRVL